MTEIVTIIILLAFSAFFSASETALSSVNRIRLKNYAAGGDKKAIRALEMATKFDHSLTAILIGNNVVNIASASLGTVIFSKYFPGNGVAIATVVMTIAVLIFGEVLPKSFAKENAEKVALSVSGILTLLIKILTPIIWLFSKLRKAFSKLFMSGNPQPSVTEDELKYIIEEIKDEGVLEEQEGNLVKSALEFDEIAVSEILIPRVNIIAIEVNQPLNTIKELFNTENYSRIPVYEKSIDNIVGIINQKDFLILLLEGGKNIHPIIRKPLYISGLKLISEVLRDMQRTKTHIAIVMDQYGGTSGIVTLEDVIEELVGEIYDESDEIIPTFTHVGTDNSNTFEVSGELSVSDLLENLELPNDFIDSYGTSVGGWVMELLERIPVNGDTITQGIFDITVLAVNDQKIEKIILKVETNNTQQT